MTQTIASGKKYSSKLLSWSVVLAASLFFLYEFIQLNLFNAIDEQLMQSFGLTASNLGKLSSMYFYGDALFLIPAGLLLDRYSTKYLLIVAGVLATVGTFVFGIASTFWVAAISRFIVGVGAAFCFLSCIRLASRWFPPQKMAFVTGIVVTMAMLGGLVAQTPLILLSQAYGWRFALGVDTALGVVVIILLMIMVKDHPADQKDLHLSSKAQLVNLGLWRSLKLVLSNPVNWLGGLYTSLMNLPVFLLGALWGIHYLIQVHHLTAVEASYATTLFFVGVILGSPIFGWLSDYIGRRVLPMLVGSVLSFIVIALLLWVPVLSLHYIIILFFLIGFFTSSQVLSYPVIAELNSLAVTGTAMSVASIAIIGIGGIFQPFFGWLMEWHGSPPIINGIPQYTSIDFSYAMLVMPIAFVIAFFIALCIKETYCQSQVARIQDSL